MHDQSRTVGDALNAGFKGFLKELIADLWYKLHNRIYYFNRPMVGQFSFCETMAASARTPWHIRPLDRRGRKLGGGAYSPGLCGRQVSWDLTASIDPHHLTHACATCSRIYLDQISTASQS